MDGDGAVKGECAKGDMSADGGGSERVLDGTPATHKGNEICVSD